jgi:hypothetical protein
MEGTDKKVDESVPWRSRRQRLRLECRECEIICERVISPWHCLRSSCPCIYSYKDDETTYFGCLHKVFAPELDLAAFQEGRAQRGRGPDPYGSLRVSRTPWPQCRVTIEQAYEATSSASSCCNPTFFHHPLGSEEDKMRLIAKFSNGDTDPQG